VAPQSSRRLARNSHGMHSGIRSTAGSKEGVTDSPRTPMIQPPLHDGRRSEPDATSRCASVRPPFVSSLVPCIALPAACCRFRVCLLRAAAPVVCCIMCFLLHLACARVLVHAVCCLMHVVCCMRRLLVAVFCAVSAACRMFPCSLLPCCPLSVARRLFALLPIVNRLFQNSTLPVACCMLPVACCMLHVSLHVVAVRCMLLEVWRMSPVCAVHVACCSLHVVRCMPHVVWKLSVARCVSSVAFSPLHIACRVLHFPRCSCMLSIVCCTFPVVVCGIAVRWIVSTCPFFVACRTFSVACGLLLVARPGVPCHMVCAACLLSHVASRHVACVSCAASRPVHVLDNREATAVSATLPSP
jgi:hypothetical protein